MIYASILAAGCGSRMNNTNKPKQYLKIGNIPIIIHTIQKFLLFPEIDYILVSVGADWIEYTKRLLEEYQISSKKIILICGGASRSDTISDAIKYIENHFGLTADDFLITHDSVRPFISHRIIDEHIKCANEYTVVNTVIHAEDTIVKIEKGNVNIPIRDFYYQGQTPQSFKIKEYLKCVERLTATQYLELTDVVKVFTSTTQGKLNIYNVSGEKSNFKITTPFDLNVANYLIETI